MESFHQLLVSSELGGAGFVGLRIAEALRDAGRLSYAWVPGNGPAARKARDLDIDLCLYDPARALTSSRLQGIWCNWSIGRLLRKKYPGLIHIHSPLFYGALSLAVRISGLKSVVHVHLEEDKKGLRWAFRSPPDVIVTCARFLNDYIRQVLPERFQCAQRIVAVPNAVNLNQFYPGDKVAYKAKYGVSREIAIVLMVANLAPHKGHETALRAAAVLKDKGITAQFWFAGTERGESQNYGLRLTALAADLGIADRVKFLGHRNDVPELLRAADCFVLPSLLEGLPLSILEAQATKTPVIAAPTAGIPEVVVDERTGFLVPAGDYNGYANNLGRLLNSPKLSSQIVENAYSNILREHTWKTYFDRVIAVYELAREKSQS